MGRREGARVARGASIGRYEVGDLLGAGGFGNVYRARDPRIGRDVAIKLLHSGRCDARNVARFEREARTVNAIRHDGVVEIFDFGISEQGQHFFVMELLRGRSLAEILDARGALPAAEALPLLLRIAEIVDAVHAQGASHGDLKPANIMLLDDGRVKLIDFGLARLAGDVDRTTTGDAFGSPLYMAPEQCRGTGAGPASDRYAFGTVAYHVLTGVPPFAGEPIAVALAHVERAPRKPSRVGRRLTGAIDDGLLALLAKDPAARPHSLVAVVRGMQRPRWRRPRTAITALALCTLALAIGVAIAKRPTAASAAVPLRIRHVEAVPASNLVAMSLAGDGTAIEILDPDGMTRVAWDGTRTPVAAPSAYRSTFPDGRVVESTGMVVVVGRDGTRRRIGVGELAEACRDNRSIALVAEHTLFVVDANTGTGGPVARAPGARGARWSPDCRRLVWGNHAGLHVTDVRTRKTRDLPARLARPLQAHAPAAFVDAHTLVYCRREIDDSVALVARRLDRLAPEVPLHVFPAEVAGCSVAVARGRIAVATFAHAESLAVLDNDGGVTTVLGDDHGSPVGHAFLDEAHVIAATHPVQSSALTSPPRDAAEVVTRDFEQVGLDGARTPLAPCEGTLAMTRYRGELVHVVLAGQRYQLRAQRTCKLVRDLALPERGVWSPPACIAERCFSTLLRDRELVAYQLAPRSAVLETIPRENGASDGTPQPAFAVAPDGAHAVVQACGEPVAYVLDLARPTAPVVRIGGATGEALGPAVWRDPRAFVVRAGGLDGTLVAHTLDGAPEPIVGEAADVLAVSPSGARVLFRRVMRRHVLHLFEVTP